MNKAVNQDLHYWYSKIPPQYIFICDIWVRETDGKEFMMTPDSFLSADGEKIYYTKKNKILPQEGL